MREAVDRMLAQIREWFSNMPRKRRLQLLILTLVVIALAITAVALLSRTNWVPIPETIVDPAIGPAVFQALQGMGEQVRTSGNQVLVPEARLSDVRMLLRSQGLLDVTDFDRSRYMPDASGFGVTAEHARQLYDMQLADDIAFMIRQDPRIHSANVIINSGETSPFRVQTNARAASASVIVTLRDGGMLTQSEANAIGEIVRNAVPGGIDYDNISIIDNNLNTYRVGDVSQDLDVQIAHRLDLQNRLIGQMQMQVEQLLAPVFGAQNLRIQPRVVLNFDRVVEERVEFEPPIAGELEGIVRSMEEISEATRRWADAEGIPGTDSNAMGSVEYPYGPLGENDIYVRNVISRNVEINETRTMIEYAQGTIEELSIAVNINSETEGIDEDFTAQVTNLVANVTGVGQGNITVELLPFRHIDTTVEDMLARMEEERAAERTRELIDTIIMYAVILALGIMVLLLIRTIFKALRPIPEPEPELALATGPGIDYIVDDEEENAQRELEEVELVTKSPGLEQIERFIDKDSASVAQLLRNWLSDE